MNSIERNIADLKNKQKTLDDFLNNKSLEKAKQELQETLNPIENELKSAQKTADAFLELKKKSKQKISIIEKHIEHLKKFQEEQTSQKNTGHHELFVNNQKKSILLIKKKSDLQKENFKLNTSPYQQEEVDKYKIENNIIEIEALEKTITYLDKFDTHKLSSELIKSNIDEHITEERKKQVEEQTKINSDKGLHREQKNNIKEIEKKIKNISNEHWAKKKNDIQKKYNISKKGSDNPEIFEKLLKEVATKSKSLEEEIKSQTQKQKEIDAKRELTFNPYHPQINFTPKFPESLKKIIEKKPHETENNDIKIKEITPEKIAKTIDFYDPLPANQRLNLLTAAQKEIDDFLTSANAQEKTFLENSLQKNIKDLKSQEDLIQNYKNLNNSNKITFNGTAQHLQKIIDIKNNVTSIKEQHDKKYNTELKDCLPEEIEKIKKTHSQRSKIKAVNYLEEIKCEEEKELQQSLKAKNKNFASIFKHRNTINCIKSVQNDVPNLDQDKLIKWIEQYKEKCDNAQIRLTDRMQKNQAELEEITEKHSLLKEKISEQQKEVIKTFKQKFTNSDTKTIVKNIFDDLKKNNPNSNPEQIITATKKALENISSKLPGKIDDAKQEVAEIELNKNLDFDKHKPVLEYNPEFLEELKYKKIISEEKAEIPQQQFNFSEKEITIPPEMNQELLEVIIKELKIINNDEEKNSLLIELENLEDQLEKTEMLIEGYELAQKNKRLKYDGTQDHLNHFIDLRNKFQEENKKLKDQHYSKLDSSDTDTLNKVKTVRESFLKESNEKLTNLSDEKKNSFAKEIKKLMEKKKNFELFPLNDDPTPSAEKELKKTKKEIFAIHNNEKCLEKIMKISDINLEKAITEIDKYILKHDENQKNSFDGIQENEKHIKKFLEEKSKLEEKIDEITNKKFLKLKLISQENPNIKMLLESNGVQLDKNDSNHLKIIPKLIEELNEEIANQATQEEKSNYIIPVFRGVEYNYIKNKTITEPNDQTVETEATEQKNSYSYQGTTAKINIITKETGVRETTVSGFNSYGSYGNVVALLLERLLYLKHNHLMPSDDNTARPYEIKTPILTQQEINNIIETACKKGIFKEKLDINTRAEFEKILAVTPSLSHQVTANSNETNTTPSIFEILKTDNIELYRYKAILSHGASAMLNQAKKDLTILLNDANTKLPVKIIDNILTTNKTSFEQFLLDTLKTDQEEKLITKLTETPEIKNCLEKHDVFNRLVKNSNPDIAAKLINKADANSINDKTLIETAKLAGKKITAENSEKSIKLYAACCKQTMKKNPSSNNNSSNSSNSSSKKTHLEKEIIKILLPPPHKKRPLALIKNKQNLQKIFLNIIQTMANDQEMRQTAIDMLAQNRRLRVKTLNLLLENQPKNQDIINKLLEPNNNTTKIIQRSLINIAIKKESKNSELIIGLLKSSTLDDDILIDAIIKSNKRNDKKALNALLFSEKGGLLTKLQNKNDSLIIKEENKELEAAKILIKQIYNEDHPSDNTINVHFRSLKRNEIKQLTDQVTPHLKLNKDNVKDDNLNQKIIELNNVITKHSKQKTGGRFSFGRFSLFGKNQFRSPTPTTPIQEATTEVPTPKT